MRPVCPHLCSRDVHGFHRGFPGRRDIWTVKVHRGCPNPFAPGWALRRSVVWVLPLEDPDKIISGHVLLIYPLVMGWGIALPSDQELQLLAATKDPFAKDLFNFPLFFSFDDVRRGFKEVFAVFHCFFIWGEERRVEDIVYLPRGRNLHFVGHGGYFSNYPEGSVSLWREFGAVVRPFDVLAF